MPDETQSGLGQELDDPKALHQETCRYCQDAKDQCAGKVVVVLPHASQKQLLEASNCNIGCSHGVVSSRLRCNEKLEEKYKRARNTYDLASSSNTSSAEKEEEEENISTSMSRMTSEAADAVTDSAMSWQPPATSSRQDQMLHDALRGSSDNHRLKAPEDATVTASSNQRLQDSHSASDFERTAEQLVAEDPETATAPPSSGYDTSLDSWIRSLVPGSLCTAAHGHNDDLDEHTDEDLGSAERQEDHPLVEAEDNNEMESDETFYVLGSGACLLGSNLKGTLVPSPYTGELHAGTTNLQQWFAPGVAMNLGTIMPSFDMHVTEAAFVQYGIDQVLQ
ncbi:unnamed protein product [Sphagnum troendelagicum]|uniref:Uncharacterized protein n=1 Tax=Sphagnum troendelagicum TaxID=128251 RepID=A0ABP0TGS6_9BRYO